MDYEKLIKKEFKFLKKYGFKTYNYTMNFEIEFIFSKGNISVGINFVEYNNNQTVGCGVTVAGKSENLLHNTIFAAEKTRALKERILHNSLSAEEQIKAYAQFIAQNIDKLLAPRLL